MQTSPFIIATLALTLAHCVPVKRPPSAKEPSRSAAAKDDAENSEDTRPGVGSSKDGTKEPEGDPTASNPPDGDGGTQEPPSDGVGGDDGGTLPLKVPASQKLLYRPLGLTEGGYQSIKQASWPDKCVKGSVVPTTGALFPFNEKQTLVIRGPMVLSELVVYRKSGEKWTKLGELSNLMWQENTYGTIKNLGVNPMKGKALENGREYFTHLPEAGEKIIIARLTMPEPSSGPFNSGAQNNVPALWLLNSKIFEAPSSQYFCNCRGLGNPGGCGELDIAEIIPGDKNEVTSTLYSYEGARGGILPSPRPVSKAQIYAAVLREEKEAGEVAVLELDTFDFSLKELPDSFVAKDWMPSAKLVNKGAESLIKP